MRRHIVIALLVLASACTNDKKDLNTCERDLDCIAPGTRCDVVQKRCVCANNDACTTDEFCNRAGVCQKKTGCGSNEDCDSDTYCDVNSGQCLPGPAQMLSSACGLASHCPYGTICVDDECKTGCFDDGDCILGEICLNDICQTGVGVCSDDDFCGYGERCDQNMCEEDRRGPYCRGCSFRTVLNPEPCDNARNFCLINSAEQGGHRQFCGVDCSLGQPCPNGYNCNFVVILTDDLCVSSAQCACDRDTITFATRTCTVSEACDPRNPDGSPAPDVPFCVRANYPDCNPPEGGDASCILPNGQTNGSCSCAVDADCGAGQTCVGGQCCGDVIAPDRECRGGEGRVSGFCNCATDNDCPRDSCDPSRGACAISGRPCTPGGTECGAIPCVNGGCQIGQNCAPIQGLACSDVGG